MGAASTDALARVERETGRVAAISSARIKLFWLVVASAGLWFGSVAWTIVREPGASTTYAGGSANAAVLFVGAGWALIYSGLLIGLRRRGLGAASVLAGFVWFAPVWDGWEGGPALVRTLGMFTSGFGFVILLHVVVAAAVARPTPRWFFPALGGASAVLTVDALALALVRDPYLDPYCWSNCTANTFLIRADPALADRVTSIGRWTTILLAVALLWICVVWWSRSRISRRRHGLMLVGGAVLATSRAVHSVLLIRGGREDPSNRAMVALFVADCVAALSISFGLFWPHIHERLVRRSVSRVVAGLSDVPAAGALAPALAHAVGDPHLQLVYWLPALARFSDAFGYAVAAPIANGVRVTDVVRDGQLVAVIGHRIDPSELELAMSSDLRLALDNERLQAEVLARMHDVRGSRARIVDAGDRRRRQLERDLHDGAQQSLLGLSYDVRRARAAAGTANGAVFAELFAEAIRETQTALAELRELSHGIFPAVLEQAGLGPAVATLADSTEIFLDVESIPSERLPMATETAAYVVIAEGLREATRVRADGAALNVVRSGDCVVVDLTISENVEPMGDVVHVADRVGAVGGTLLIEPCRLRAEIPCGS